jgi:hypothetical protein
MDTIPPAPAIPIQSTPPATAPGPTPRPLTPRARKLAWSEPRVRRWWLLAAMVLITFSLYAADRLWARAQETQLIHSGIPVTAKVVGAENKIGGMPIGPGDFVRLEITWPSANGDLVDADTGHLSGPSVVGSDVKIFVDPADHSRWTDRTTPTPLLDSLLIGLLMLPLIPVMVWLAFVEAGKLLSIWQNGTAQIAVIFDRKHSSIAPMSYVLRCSLQAARQKELFTVYVPRIAYGLEKGDLIWVITPSKKGRPLANLWMAGEQG